MNSGATIELSVGCSPTGHLLTEVGIGGQPPRLFLVDTAASGSLVSTPALPPDWEERIAEDAEGVVHGAGGALAKPRRFLRERLRLGGWASPEMELTVLDLSPLAARLGAPVAGVLGLDVLALGDLWLDLPAGRLFLSAGPEATRPAREAPHLFLHQPFRRSPDGFLLLDLELADRSGLTALLDLGAATSLLNEAAADRIPTAGDAPRPAGKAVALGADNRSVPVTPLSLGGLRLGGAEAPPFPVYAAPLPVFARLGLADSPAMLLGLDFFARRALGISFPGGILYVAAET